MSCKTSLYTFFFALSTIAPLASEIRFHEAYGNCECEISGPDLAVADAAFFERLAHDPHCATCDTLFFHECSSLREISPTINSLPNIKILFIWDCPLLRQLPDITLELEILRLQNNSALEALPSISPKIQYLIIYHCPHIHIERLPELLDAYSVTADHALLDLPIAVRDCKWLSSFSIHYSATTSKEFVLDAEKHVRMAFPGGETCMNEISRWYDIDCGGEKMRLGYLESPDQIPFDRYDKRRGFLDLSDAGVIAFSADFFTLLAHSDRFANIKKIDLSDNEELHDIPDSISMLRQLEQIGLSRTWIEHFPKALLTIPTLTAVRLDQTSLTNASFWGAYRAYLCRKTHAYILPKVDSRYSTRTVWRGDEPLPAHITDFRQIQYLLNEEEDSLDLTSCPEQAGIEVIDAAIFRQAVPDELLEEMVRTKNYGLSKVKHLALDGNAHLHDLPRGIERVLSLEIITANGTRIERLSPEAIDMLKRLPRLEGLALSGTPLALEHADYLEAACKEINAARMAAGLPNLTIILG